ncbi:MAG: UdgX family uracil-DNA binding protein [Mycobacterium kyogaense]|uniref:UdgX family uracil-DNA binding protein n=1 Tax=Mycobacterium kyogaense TaxID=2212479 RepID=UPI002FFBD3C5
MPSRAPTVTAADFLPSSTDLDDLAAAAGACRGCDLFSDATQTVFGEGPAGARMMLVGEQPGDQEDRSGEPFVGPAGRLLDTALREAGIDREPLYVTNAVKHFKFVPAERGTRRIHKTPSRTEVVSCRPWLLAELDAVAPEVIVCLGATAAKSLLGNDFRLTAHRGEVLRLPGDVSARNDPAVVATLHPSAVLRGPAEAREDSLASLVSDLRVAAGQLRR